MQTTSEKNYSFGDFELNGAKRLLVKNGEIIALYSKTFDLLLALVENHGRVLSKDELLEKVWEGQFVEENNLSVQIAALRKIFGEKKGEYQFIATISGKGYKFVAEIRNGNEHSSVKVKESLPNQSRKLADGETIIGRAAEIAEIKSLIANETVKLITLTGAGGAGKTSLAQVVGNELKADFADGVFFVELAAVRDAELVAPTIMQTLGANETENQNFTEVLKNFLRERQILLILDNFEQVSAAATLVGELLESSAKLKILITSRIALRLENETEFAVLPLSVPPTDANLSFEKLSDYAAVELFINRAKTVKPNFTLSRENAKAIAEICRKLDGLPLAIELAAARVKLLSPESIFTRLESSLNLLTGNAPTYFQRTMRETIGWSYDLLDEQEQKLFRRLAVFVGGFTIEAAEFLSEPSAVAGGQLRDEGKGMRDESEKDLFIPHPSSLIPQNPPATADGSDSVLDLLDSLIENNLLVVKEQTDGDARLRMLEVVREFAAECLESSGEAEILRRKHSEFFLALAEEIEPLLLTEKVVKALEKFDAELDNFRAALCWLLSREIEMMVRMTAALRQFWYNRSYLTEARQWLETALAKSEITPNPTRFKLLNAISLVTRTQGDYAATRRASEESLTASRTIKDLRQIILSCHAVAGLEIRENNLAKARKLYEESLVISRELNDERQIAFSLSGVSNVLLNEGHGAAARPLLEEALIISRRMGFKFNLSTDLINLGTVNYYESDAEAAYQNFAESLAIAREIKSTAYISCCLDGFAAVAAISENPKQAARLSGAAESLRESIGYEIESTERIFRDDYLKKVLAGFDRKSFAAAYQEGQNLDLNEAVALAESSFFVPDKEETEIIIETHKLERVFIEEEIVEHEKPTKLVQEIIWSNEKPTVSAWLKKNFAIIIIAFLAVAAIGIGYFWLNGKSPNGVLFGNSSVKQLTTNGKVSLAALAPDGKTFAYVVNDSGLRSLWLGFVDGGNHLQLRPAAEDARYANLAFAPDGNRLYFSFKDDKKPNSALYRMPVSGGVQEKVLDNIDNFSLAPDGKQIAFGRREGEKDLLFIADLDGAKQREIASFPKNESFVFNSFSWSPDGHRLAFSKLKDSKTLGNDLAIVEISSGKVQIIENEIWRDTAKTVWLKDGNGVIVHAVKYGSWTSVPQYHVFYVEVPSGKTHEISNDLSSYDSSLDISEKSDALLTIVHRQLNNIWVAPADNLSAAKQITFGSFGKYDGLWGMDFTPDGKIIYTNSDTQSQFLSEMNADGSGSKPITAPGIVDSVLNVSNDGRYIVFHSNRNGGDFDIWRTDIDGNNPKQLTFGKKNYQPFVSADNLWVYYKSWENDVGELRRVSIDGGEPEILNDKETSWLSFSPDGKYFAAAYKTDKTRLAIFDATTNKPIKQLDLPKNATMSMGTHWSPDSRAVAFRDWNDGYWLQSIEGGEPQKMQGLPNEKLYNFAWSKDGKQFAFVRGQEIRDVVLISNRK